MTDIRPLTSGAKAPLATSISDVFLYVSKLRETAEHVAVFVGSDALWPALIWRRDEGGHIAVLDAADANTLPERRVHFFI